VRNGVPVANRGVVGVEAGDVLDIVGGPSGPTAPVLDNFGGVIGGDVGSVLALHQLTVNGGVIDATRGRVKPFDAGSVTFGGVAVEGQQLDTFVARLRFTDTVNLRPGSMVTVGSPFLPGGSLLVGGATLIGTGSIRILPGGTLHGGAFIGDGVTIFGNGTVDMTSATLSAGATLVARPLQGIPGEPRLTLRTGRFTTAGQVIVESGATLDLSGSPGGGIVDAGGSITIRSGGTLTSTDGLSISLIRNDGLLRFSGIASATGGAIEGIGQTQVADRSVRYHRIDQSELTLTGAARVFLSPEQGASRVERLAIGPAAQIALDDSAIVIDYAGPSPLDDIRALVTSGYAGGQWDGPGIASSLARFPVGRAAVGYAEAVEIGVAGGTFLGVAVDDTAVLVRYTLAGDADLDATVTLADFARLSARFNGSADWSSGDFNYDRTADIGDFALLAGNFNAALPASVARAAVPEPAALPAALAVVLAARIRRRCR
jgi:hypothetical protein